MLLLFENLLPLRNVTRPLACRFAVNVIMSLFVFTVGALVVKPVAMKLVAWSGKKAVGLLHLADLPTAAGFALGFLLMDLSFYYWHRINHLVPVLWRIHGIHHSSIEAQSKSNCSSIFIWWDRIHLTALLDIRQSDLIIGVSGYLKPGTNLLIMPFRGTNGIKKSFSS
ncbi:MAG: sterol desaturase family protein [bacterium]|nr:sterol desaturase family protein [bacterium]